MSETYVPTPTEQNSSCTMPEDGDPLTAASVRAALEEHSDAIDNLENIVGTPAAITRTIVAMPNWLVGAEYDTGNMRVNETNTADDASVRSDVVWELPLPHGSTLQSVTIYVDGAGAVLPAVLGELYVQMMNAATGVGSNIANATDPSASGAAFGARHAVTVSGMSHVVDRTDEHLRIRYRGHHNSGGGAMTTGTDIWHPLVTFLPATVDLGAA